jgi:NADPH-dependent 2,4-dienoyl-CoA reductase/sulfur reductase-like enzyme
MPHFWRFSHKRRRQDSGEEPLKVEAAEISGIVLRVDNEEEREQRLTKLLRKPSGRSLRFPTPEEQIPPMSDVAVVGAGPAGLMLA